MTYGSREIVYNGKDSKVKWGGSREAESSHLQPHAENRENELEVGSGYELLKCVVKLPPAMFYILKISKDL